MEEGILDRVGPRSWARLLLSRRFYRHLGKAGVYTRKRGLDRETNKALLVRHLRETGPAGSPISDSSKCCRPSREASSSACSTELRQDGRVRLGGTRRGARWHSSEAGQA